MFLCGHDSFQLVPADNPPGQIRPRYTHRPAGPKEYLLPCQTFDPFGSVITQVQRHDSPFLYSYLGQLTDQTGLVTLNGRPYDPATGLHYDSPYAYSFDYKSHIGLQIAGKSAGPAGFSYFGGQWATGVICQNSAMTG